MSDEKYLFIGEVARLTGLTERALRFYEERGLVEPVRTEGGRRAYAANDLIRIHHVILLRRTSFSLSQIKQLLEQSDFDAQSLIDLQIETLQTEYSIIDTSLKSLRAARSQLSEGKGIDLETLCELIRIGERKMQDDAWQKVYDKYYTPEEQKKWRVAKEKLAPGWDQEEYENRWRDLSVRIEKSLPIDPSSEKAQAFLQEWNTLLKPFTTLADNEMKSGAARLWNNMDEWSSQVDAPISKPVWECIAAAAQARKMR